MLAFLIYSGKGGVGKTTLTYSLYKAFSALGHKTAVLDMDLNTPSYHHLETNEDVISSSSNLGLFVETAQINNFTKHAFKKIKALNPDILLIDSPPSITQIHYSIIDKFNVSSVILVTQPTTLSISDVEKTVPFFEEKGITVAGIIENMSNNEVMDYKYNVLTSIKRIDTLDSVAVYEQNKDEFSALASKLLTMDFAQVSQENRKRVLLDESITFDDVIAMYGIEEDEDGEYRLSYGNKARKLKDIKFVNTSTWEQLRDIVLNDNRSYQWGLKDVLTEATPERVSRLVNAFKHDEKAMFMVTRNTYLAIDIVIGEVGSCTLVLDSNHHGIPCVEYQTSQGNAILFAHEVMPVDQETIDNCIEDGYEYIDNGSRMIPNLATAQYIGLMDGRVDVTEKWHRLNERRGSSKTIS